MNMVEEEIYGGFSIKVELGPDGKKKEGFLVYDGSTWKWFSSLACAKKWIDGQGNGSAPIPTLDEDDDDDHDAGSAPKPG